MAELPSGDVTFLFTDVEGSTRLWERDPAAMWAAIARHNAILGEAIASHGGHHFKTIGDAFQAAFHDPLSGVRAVAAVQWALDAEPWPETGPIRVRMALHCGEAAPVDGDYLAPCLNRLARLLGAGYGGQVLLTDSVAKRIADRLPADLRLLDLGRHRLRDLLEPEQVSQLVISGLPDHFPPLKSLEGHPHNLPIQPTPLIGRTAELATLQAWLREDGDRLVVLTGPGGTGKTRLALQLAANLLNEMPDGVFVVDLDPAVVTDATLVLPRIAETLGVREGGDRSLFDALVVYLNGKRLLLVLDNFEQVLDAGADIGRLLRACAGISVVITSRARLGIRAEREFPVLPLPTPDPRRLPPLAELAEIDAVRLFLQRAAAVRSDFALTDANAASVAAICARLDGLPLAIELAAARIRAMSPQMLLDRLVNRLALLKNGARDLPERQQTLRATIEWSHSLLAPAEQALFARLAVFAGGFQLDVAEALFGNDAGGDVIDGVMTLVDHSMLRAVTGGDGEPRYTMLETLREFGLERLAAEGAAGRAREAHAGWCLALADEAGAGLAGADQTVWIDRLEVEHDNLRGGLGWMAEAGRAGDLLTLAGALAPFWEIRGFLTEGRRWLEQALAGAPAAGEPASELRAVLSAGNLAHMQGRFEQARAHYETGVVLARTIGDQGREASLLSNLGSVALALGDLDEAAALYRRSLALADALGDRRRRGNALANLGAVAHYRGEIADARERYAECLALWRELGDRHGETDMLLNLLLLLSPDPDQADAARNYGEECLSLARRLGARQVEAFALSGLGSLETARGRPLEAIRQHEQSLKIFRELDDQSGIGRELANLGLALIDRSETARAIDLLLQALRLNLETGEQDGAAFALEGLAVAMTACNEVDHGARLFGAAARLRTLIDVPPPAETTDRRAAATQRLRVLLGQAFNEAWAAGQALSPEQAAQLVERVTYLPTASG